MWHRKLALAGLTVAMWLSAARAASAQTTLRYQFKKGEKLQYVLEQKMTTKFTAKSFNAESTVNQTIDMSWTVKDAAADGKATVTVKFERLRLTLGELREKATFDSKDGKEPEGKLASVAAALKATAALEFDMTVDARSKVDAVRFSEKSTEAVKGLARTSGAEALTPEEVQKTMNQALLALPAEVIKPGATWNQTLSTKAAYGTVKVEQTFEYKGVKDRGGKMLAEIAITPTISVTADAKAMVKLKEQKGQGSAFFDQEAGRLAEMSATQSMTLDISLGGQEVTQEIRQIVNMKLQ